MLNPITGALAPLTRPPPRAYSAKVLATASAHLLAYWKLDETGGSTANDSSGSSRNGAYSGITLNGTTFLDGTPAPTMAGTNNYVNLYSSSFVGAWNGQEFTVSLFCRCPNWTDGTERRVFHLLATGSNLLVFRKSAANNQFEVIYIAGGISRVVTKTSFAPAGFFSVVATASLSANQFKVYFDGVQEGSTQTVGTWAGSLDPAQCAIGARGASATNPWRDSAAHVAVWNTALTATDAALLATVP